MELEGLLEGGEDVGVGEEGGEGGALGEGALGEVFPEHVSQDGLGVLCLGGGTV